MNRKGLFLKSYFAATVKKALEAGRRELGPDALLVATRAAAPGTKHRGRYEVVLATEPIPADETGLTRESEDGWSAAFDRLSAQLKEIAGLLSSSRLEAAFGSLPPELAGIASEMIAAGVEPGAVDELMRCALARGCGKFGVPRKPGPKAYSPEALRAALAAELGARVCVDPTVGRGDSGKAVVALVGPPGAGKTTTAIKLAVRYGLQANRPVVLISSDTLRIGGAEHLRAGAAVLGVRFQGPLAAARLPEVIERARGLVVIDTPGYSSFDFGRSAELAAFLTDGPGVDVQLVLPASMRARDLASCADRYGVFRPGKLIFTKLDETESPAAAAYEALRTGRPVSFLSTGPAIPGDIEEADLERIIGPVGADPQRKAFTAA